MIDVELMIAFVGIGVAAALLYLTPSGASERRRARAARQEALERSVGALRRDRR